MILTVIEHAPSAHLDRFAGWLAQAPEAPEIALVRPWAGDRVPTLAESGDGLLVLGGPQHAYDDEGSPWLPATRALLADATHAQLPTLGICLGAELLAVATGGAVQVAAPPGREAGAIAVAPRPDAATDPLLGDLAADVPADHPLGGGVLAWVPSMHADAVVTLPPGAVWLGSSRQYPYQAFRVGAAAWGLQFHPEASAATVVGWAHGLGGVDAEDVAAQLHEHADDVERAGRAIALSFAELVATSARTARELAG
ncbi:type 1 glutamine amidotransferase [Isoptericola sp. b441]|uniref:Type 1 glutamine amidotransferase n=1 Tax=Actinotalea lenta TaxID=3064654 RepID=A0ABT9D7Y4_9CELL|nr:MULTISPECIES: type 1 glutamine amidotransferase [unclassified Isoptericola]MDO8106660.1 type 1 glutamine amidotransferase [Isoptericola sp. b441]MDO8121632.1 type 1 glutamine amidotransferase [Isoptericola sp. b490]